MPPIRYAQNGGNLELFNKILPALLGQHWLKNKQEASFRSKILIKATKFWPWKQESKHGVKSKDGCINLNLLKQFITMSLLKMDNGLEFQENTMWLSNLNKKLINTISQATNLKIKCCILVIKKLFQKKLLLRQVNMHHWHHNSLIWFSHQKLTNQFWFMTLRRLEIHKCMNRSSMEFLLLVNLSMEVTCWTQKVSISQPIGWWINFLS